MDMEDTQSTDPLPQERGVDLAALPRRMENIIISRDTGPLRGDVDRAKLAEFIRSLPEKEPVSPGDLDPQVRAKVEGLIRRLADSRPEWAGQDIDAVNLYCFDPSSEDLRGSSGGAPTAGNGSGLQWREVLVGDPIDEALSRDLDPDECGRLERRIRMRARANSRHYDEMDWIWAMWDDDAPADIMGKIGNCFAEAGDFLRLGILSQKRPC